ncbi:TadE/TadG family type IV pilus assembly protein [Mesorhizobium sp. VNQ89]|uniref:TadE/TadG family type IV pilus assembly protein n=1 Tax=Mesorhizobium quangtriensis TaxID=3157709 RepID=UPI0032B8670A
MAWVERFRSDEKGSVLVEMTLITPLMIALSAGVFEFGNLIHQKLMIEAGLRDAARYAARCTDAVTGVNCLANARAIAAFGSVAGTTERVSGWDSADVSITTYTTANNVDAITGLQDYRGTTAQVTTVRATASVPYVPVGLLAAIGIGSITLNAAHEERFIGY